MTLDLSESGCLLVDMGSLNGVRVNGLTVRRQALEHRDVIEIGNHKIHVLDDAMLPWGDLDLESTVQGADAAIAQHDAPESPPHLDETQPGTACAPAGPAYALKRIGEAPAEAAPLEPLHTVVGAPGKAALIVRRRDKLVLTKLSRLPLNVNGREVDGASVPVDVGDVIDVGAARYQLVRMA